jgi:NAD(P)-dependent dehydrogenase (short-subunit alcohol dehydrogenase family)
MASFLVTGASRGLGLALVKDLISRPSSEVGKIIAAVRGDAPALDEVAQKSSGKVAIIKLDVTDQESIKKAASDASFILGDKGLDVLINNAGICEYASNGVASM